MAAKRVNLATSTGSLAALNRARAGGKSKKTVHLYYWHEWMQRQREREGSDSKYEEVHKRIKDGRGNVSSFPSGGNNHLSYRSQKGGKTSKIM